MGEPARGVPAGRSGTRPPRKLARAHAQKFRAGRSEPRTEAGFAAGVSGFWRRHAENPLTPAAQGGRLRARLRPTRLQTHDPKNQKRPPPRVRTRESLFDPE